MIYLSGYVRDDLPPGVGVMTTPVTGNRMPADRWWAADTGCFARPERHDDDRYIAWLAQVADPAMCLFATAADRFGDGPATLEVARPLLPRIRQLGIRAALVLQPGVDDLPWDEFDCLFLGGPNDWQRDERRCHPLVYEAQRRGKWTHRGRVNSQPRLLASKAMGFDSADGTHIMYKPLERGREVARWAQVAAMQEALL